MDHDRLFLICFWTIIVVGTVLLVLYIGILSSSPPYTIERDGNTVSFELNRFSVSGDWDVIKLYMNNKTDIMYLHGKIGHFYGYHSVDTPQYEKVHVVVEVTYINGTKERIVDGLY